MAEKATGPFETQGGKEKFPVGVGGEGGGEKIVNYQLNWFLGKEEGRESCIITFTDFGALVNKLYFFFFLLVDFERYNMYNMYVGHHW